MTDAPRQLDFRLDVDDRAVPGVLWTPDASVGPWPTVLYGHGGTGHKHDAHTRTGVARLLSRGVAVAVIDGPMHGERAPRDAGRDPHEFFVAYRAFIADRGADAVAASMVADWRATIDHLVERGHIDPRRLGYWGVSMGSRFGIPLLAAEPRLRAAVIGLIGPEAGDSITAAAAQVTVPVRSILNWDDELFAIGGAIGLYAAIPAADKRLCIVPGAHGEVPDDEYERLAAFLVDALRP
jgi:dienelactone hydrolase